MLCLREREEKTPKEGIHFKLKLKDRWIGVFVGSQLIAQKVYFANTFWTRLIGLLWKEDLLSGECLLLEPCRQVHTFGMKFPLDVLFLDRDWRIIGVIKNMLPGRISPYFKSAWMAIEFKGGTLPDIILGEHVRFVLGERKYEAGHKTDIRGKSAGENCG